MFEPKHDNPLNFFRNSLGDSAETKQQFHILASKIKVLEERNDLLKTLNVEVTKLLAILECFSCENEKMEVNNDEPNEAESKIVHDIEMQVADGISNIVLLPAKNEMNEMESEHCDFSDARNSTLNENLDTDMSEFEESLFNTKTENPKLAQKQPEPVTEQCESAEIDETTALVSGAVDALTIESERASEMQPEMEMVSDENVLNPEISTAVDAPISTEPLIDGVESESISIPNDEEKNLSKDFSETFIFEKDSEMPSETGVLDAFTPFAEEIVTDIHQLPTIVEETDVALTANAEDNSEMAESSEEHASGERQLSSTLEATLTPQKIECAPQTTQDTTESISASSDLYQSAEIVETCPSADAAKYGSECESSPHNQSSSFGCPKMAIGQMNAQAPDMVAEPSIIEMENEMTVSAPETATIENDSVISCEIAAVTGILSDTLSAETNNGSVPTSQQSLTADCSEDVITEIRSVIMDAVLNTVDDNDQPDSAVPFVDESQPNTLNRTTLDDIEQYIRKEQGEGANCSADKSAIEVGAPQSAMETCEPISAQFNPSQIVSIDYTASGTEILTLDVPVSHGASSTTVFDLDTSLPLSQFASDVGEEGDYLLPPRNRDSQTKIEDTISSISFGSQPFLETTAEYNADEELDSSSSSESTVILSDNQSTLPLPVNEDQIDVPASEKNGKRKLSIPDDCETDFLLSKSRKPEMQSTPFSST